MRKFKRQLEEVARRLDVYGAKDLSLSEVRRCMRGDKHLIEVAMSDLQVVAAYRRGFRYTR